MQRFEIWRWYDYKPGCVDYLGSVEAENEDDAEVQAKDLWDFGAGEHVDVQEDTEAFCE